MNKAKTSLSVLTIIYLAVSVAGTLTVVIYEAVNNIGYFNISPVFNYFGSLIPFVLILLYCLAFYKSHIGKILLLGVVSYEAASFFTGSARLLLRAGEYIKNGAFAQFVKANYSSIIIDLGGIAVFILLLLYLLRVIRCKTALTVISFAYFILAFIMREIGIVQSLQLITRPEANLFTLYVIVSTIINHICYGLNLAIWLIFTKSVMLKN